MLVVDQSGDWVKLEDSLNRGMPSGWAKASFLIDLGPQRENAPGSDLGKTLIPSEPAASPHYPAYPSVPDPLSIDNATFDCQEGFNGEGLTDCELTLSVSVTIPSAYRPYIARSVDVECEATISYEAVGSYLSQTETERQSTTMYLRMGSSTDTLSLGFDLGFMYGEVVRSAKVESVECAPSR